MLGQVTFPDGENYVMTSFVYEPIQWSEMAEVMASDRYQKVMLKNRDGQIIYAGLYLIFDDVKVINSRKLLQYADSVSEELYDAIVLVRHLHKKLGLTNEQLNKHPIIIIPHYYSNLYDFNVNVLLSNIVLQKCGKDSYSALAVNLTPCADYEFLPYLENFKEANEILDNAYNRAAECGFFEVEDDPTEYATARYMMNTNKQ